MYITINILLYSSVFVSVYPWVQNKSQNRSEYILFHWAFLWTENTIWVKLLWYRYIFVAKSIESPPFQSCLTPGFLKTKCIHCFIHCITLYTCFYERKINQTLEMYLFYRSPTLVKNIPTSLGYGAALNASLQVKLFSVLAAFLCELCCFLLQNRTPLLYVYRGIMSITNRRG